MIIVKIIGGLGNQMFQYALGRCLAVKHNTTLKLDISGFENYKLRKYELNIFNTVENFVSKTEIKRYKPKKFLNILIKNSKYIVQKYYHFDPDILNLPDDIYLDGYWQSERYFEEIKHIIRNDFSFKENPEKENLEILEKIKNTNSVSIHIRRGDYVSNLQANETHGLCDIEYYRTAIQNLEERIHNPHYFVFSDDINWAKENFVFLKNITFVENNLNNNSYEDLRLMSNCKHNIIANSSFSWWGAWLNNNENKIVFAPKRWFNKPDINTNDLIPERWIKL